MTDKKSTKKARFITFEGGEGVGKSTQVKRLIKRLHNGLIDVVSSREPGGTPRAEAVRSFVLQGKSEEWGPSAEAVLFAAARLDHVKQFIQPNLDAGKWVVLDRFHDSTRAYQGLTGGVKDKLIGALEEIALDGLKPDLTIVLDMDPKTAFERVAQRAAAEAIPTPVDRFEKEDLDWHTRLRDAFLEIAANNKDRCVVISADRSEADISKAVWLAVKQKFPQLAGEIDA